MGVCVNLKPLPFSLEEEETSAVKQDERAETTVHSLLRPSTNTADEAVPV